MPEFATQAETAAWMGYGDDVDAMNAAHDPLHASLCAWAGVDSVSLRIARGEAVTAAEQEIAWREEDAVLHVQRWLRHLALDAESPVA